MKIIHRIGLRSTASQRQELESLGIALAGSTASSAANALIAFDVEENHPHWSELLVLFRKWKVSDVVRTEFTREEIQSARWLNLLPGWHYDYPQPDEGAFGYLTATYDLSDYCAECGTGLKQKAPFQMKAEPDWGRKGILQLNWVFDEYFVRREIWRKVFEPFGIRCRAVTDIAGTELNTVVQLLVDRQSAIVTDELPFQKCVKCGRIKYLPVTRGRFPALLDEPGAHMAKTAQYFGSGRSAYRQVVLSQEIGKALASEKVLGASVKPVAGRGQARV